MSTSEGLGAKPHRRNAMGAVMSVLNRIAPVADRLGVKKPVDRVLYQATKTGFQAAGAATRKFTAARKLGSAKRLPPVSDSGVFDLTPTDEQRMIADTVREFATERLRPAAAEANEKCEAPPELLSTATELGITLLGVPEELGGVATERSTMTNVLVAEALATGDMGLALACLAPAAVSNALVLWGNEEQQATYLPAFTGEDVPAAAFAVLEPQPLFDAFALKTVATK
ncbi:acyl-CoA dehydrogenase family protein, partial [Actinophytocola sp.]|uniref:acyl-CoA dehydrogenase family protein n=1 Tax=Actinophytocola sp. TaxID=1872138 RepID=UPI00389ABB88